MMPTIVAGADDTILFFIEYFTKYLDLEPSEEAKKMEDGRILYQPSNTPLSPSKIYFQNITIPRFKLILNAKLHQYVYIPIEDLSLIIELKHRKNEHVHVDYLLEQIGAEAISQVKTYIPKVILHSDLFGNFSSVYGNIKTDLLNSKGIYIYIYKYI